MGRSDVHQRRRAYILRENPKFFDQGQNGAPRRRNSVSEEYERLVASAAYARDPKAGSEPSDGRRIPMTSPFPGANIDATKSSYFPGTQGSQHDTSLEVSRGKHYLSGSKPMVPDLDQLTLEPKQKSNLVSVVHLSTDELAPPTPVRSRISELVEQAPSSTLDTKEFGPSTYKLRREKPMAIARPEDWSSSYTTSAGLVSSGTLLNVSNLTASRVAENHVDSEQANPTGGCSDTWNTVQSARNSRYNQPSGKDLAASRGCFNCGLEGHRKSECQEPPKSSIRSCHCCGEEGHIIRECPQKGAKAKGHIIGRACNKCGQDGHFVRECPTGAGAGVIRGGRGCFTCGEHGHRATNCPQNNEAGSRPMYSGGADKSGCYRCGEIGHRARDCHTGGTEGTSGNSTGSNRHGGFHATGSEQDIMKFGNSFSDVPEQSYEPPADNEGIAW